MTNNASISIKKEIYIYKTITTISQKTQRHSITHIDINDRINK